MVLHGAHLEQAARVVYLVIQTPDLPRSHNQLASEITLIYLTMGSGNGLGTSLGRVLNSILKLQWIKGNVLLSIFRKKHWGYQSKRTYRYISNSLEEPSFENTAPLFPTIIKQLHSPFTFTLNDFSLLVDSDVHRCSERQSVASSNANSVVRMFPSRTVTKKALLVGYMTKKMNGLTRQPSQIPRFRIVRPNPPRLHLLPQGPRPRCP